MDLAFFNPHLQSEADFLASFVARGEALAYYLRQLRSLAPDEPARHHLIVAPRGYGKTSMLRRLAIAVRTEPDLAGKFIALTFREEQHNVISLDVFWRNCLQSLLEAREDEHASQEELDELDAAWESHAPRQALSRDDQDGDPAWRAFRRRCNALGRRALLLIDNLDALLAGLPPKHQWGLRGVLQQSDGPVLIAAAPRFPESVHDPRAAFHDFFRTEPLDKLTDQEVLTCLRALAAKRGEAGQPVLEMLDKTPGRVAALNALAGGNPRTLSVLYSVLESHMSADVLSQLSAMLDTFTSWYQSRAEDLPAQARAVFDALALNWDPMTAAAVGTVTGLDTTAVSSQISRLEKLGLVEAVPLTRGRGRSGYQLAERFFNIWYLMRNGPRRSRQSIRFLAVFLQSCYSAAERRALARAVMTKGDAHSGYALGLAASLNPSPLRARLLEYAEEQATLTGTRDEYAEAIAEMRSEVERQGSSPPEKPRDLATLNRAIARLQRARKDNAGLAATLHEKAGRLYEQGSVQEAMDVWQSVAKRFAGDPTPPLRESVALALFNNGAALSRLGHSERAIAVYDTILDRFGEDPAPPVRESVARALFNKSFDLGQLGQMQQAIAVYDTILHRFADDPAPLLREQVAKALFNKGVDLTPLGQTQQAIAVYDTILERFADDPAPPLRELVAKALFNKGGALGRLGQTQQAVAVYDTILERFGDDPAPLLRESVAGALVNKGVALRQLGQTEQAIAVYDTIFDRFADDPAPPLREHVSKALFNKGLDLAELGRTQQAIAVYDTILDRFAHDPAPPVREQVAKALFKKGLDLAHLGQTEQAIDIFDSIVARFSLDPAPVLRDVVVKAFLNKGVALTAMAVPERAEEALRAATAIATGDTSAHAWDLLGNLLLDHTGDPQRALAAYESGLASEATPETLALLHANAAYALALHGGDLARAREHAARALQDEASLSAAGRALLSAIDSIDRPQAERWQAILDAIGQAVASGDESLWSAYLDDLQRWIAFVLADGGGEALRRWMTDAQYPLKYAPLYHAVVAAVEGEEALLRINPETRPTAEGIYEGIARRLRLYAERSTAPPKKTRHARTRRTLSKQ